MNDRLELALHGTRPVRRRVAVCAHRGNSEECPENTLAAFRSAIELGVDAIEFDVRLTSDSKIVVVHDSSLERTTGLDRPVSRTSLDRVRSLDAGRWKGTKHAGERVPELHEVLELADGRAALVIDLKQRSHKLARAVVSELKERGLERRTIILSFFWKLLRTVKELSPDVATIAAIGVRTAQFRLALRHPYSDGIGARAPVITRRICHACLSRRKSVAAWRVNTEKDMRRLMQSEAVDLIVTDRPRVVLPFVEKLPLPSGRATDSSPETTPTDPPTVTYPRRDHREPPGREGDARA